MSIKISLVDDHKMLRQGIRQLLEFDDSLSVVSESSSGSECLSSLAKVIPDVMLLDINLPDISGLNLIKDIRKVSKKIKIIILTVHNEVEYLIDARDKGVDGYILKDSDSAELIKAIKSVFHGETYIQPDLIPALNAKLIRMETETSYVLDITKREKEILVAIAQGKSNRDIAEYFDISERTVKNHITNLFKKIDVSDRTQAAVFAIRNNLVEM